MLLGSHSIKLFHAHNMNQENAQPVQKQKTTFFMLNRLFLFHYQQMVSSNPFTTLRKCRSEILSKTIFCGNRFMVNNDMTPLNHSLKKTVEFAWGLLFCAWGWTKNANCLLWDPGQSPDRKREGGDTWRSFWYLASGLIKHCLGRYEPRLNFISYFAWGCFFLGMLFSGFYLLEDVDFGDFCLGICFGWVCLGMWFRDVRICQDTYEMRKMFLAEDEISYKFCQHVISELFGLQLPRSGKNFVLFVLKIEHID